MNDDYNPKGIWGGGINKPISERHDPDQFRRIISKALWFYITQAGGYVYITQYELDSVPAKFMLSSEEKDGNLVIKAGRNDD